MEQVTMEQVGKQEVGMGKRGGCGYRSTKKEMRTICKFIRLALKNKSTYDDDVVAGQINQTGLIRHKVTGSSVGMARLYKVGVRMKKLKATNGNSRKGFATPHVWKKAYDTKQRKRMELINGNASVVSLSHVKSSIHAAEESIKLAKIAMEKFARQFV